MIRTILEIIGVIRPDYESGLAPVEGEATMPYGFDLPKCRYVETLLNRVRNSGSFAVCKLPIEWQEESIRLAAGAYELFIINVVWFELGGYKAKSYSWGESHLRKANLLTIQKEDTACLQSV